MDAAQWDALLQGQADANPFMRHAYLAALHESGAASPKTGWTPRYLTLWRGADMVASCALYIKAHSYGEYEFDHAWANAYHQHGLHYYPKAVVAVPFTPVPGARLLARSQADRMALVQGLVAWCGEEKLSSLHLLFANDDDVAACVSAGLMLRHTVQFHWKNVAPTLVAAPRERTEGSVRHTALALQAAAPPDAAPLRAVQPRAGRLGAADFSPGGANFSRGGPVFSKSGEAKNCPLPDLMFRSFDDFLASLSQEKRKKIRQERRKVAEAGVTFRWSLGADISPSDWDFFYRCYERTYLEHGNAPYLSRKFFQRMADTMPQNWLLFVAEREGQPIAASLIAVSSSAANSIRTDSIPANATANHIITTNSIADYVYGTLAVGLNDLQLRPEPGISGNTTADEAIARDTRARDTPALHPTACEPSAPERTAYGRYWGALERVDCLHFEACYYQPLQWCIEHGYQRFEGGAQGEHKMARALMPVKTSSAHWLAQPAFADAVERFLAREGQGIESYMTDLSQRSPFRNPVPQG